MHNDHAIFWSRILSFFQIYNHQEGVLSKVIDFQKRTATLAFQDVEKIIVRLTCIYSFATLYISYFQWKPTLIGSFFIYNFQLEKNTHLKDNDSGAKCHFVEKCSQLCWMMAIQDPPMYLDFGPKKGSVIDKNVFRLYTKSGEKVDFLVWPAVFLHENGPIVQKGVLQPQWSF